MIKNWLFPLISICFIVGIPALWFFNTYEYRSVLKLPPEDSNYIVLRDTLTIEPFFYIDSKKDMVVNIATNHLSYSMRFESLKVSIASIDNSTQKIDLTHVLAYKDTVNWEDINSSYVRASTFADLPDHYRSMTTKRDFNSIRFFFETENVELSGKYLLRIAGTILYKGKIITFSKEIMATRRKEFLPIQMMT